MNQFGDLTQHEFKTQVVGGCFKGAAMPRAEVSVSIGARAPTPVDWVAKGVVQKVKNQGSLAVADNLVRLSLGFCSLTGQCGSCWAFSAIGAVESAWAIAKGALLDLSEQQLVDCAGSEGNMGCNGALLSLVARFIGLQV